MRMRLTITITVILIMAFLTVSMGMAAPEKLAGGVHIVQWGENLASIAARYGMTVEAVAQANGITDQNYIYIGQQLVIPSNENFGGAQMGSGVPATSTTGSSNYMVQFGDTLTSIAQLHATTVNDLMQANGLASSTIFIGQQLVVPGVGNAAVLPAPAQISPGPAPAQLSPGPAPAQIGPGPTSLYAVKPGDTLTAIAFRVGVAVNDIMQVNNLYSSSIFPGQQLAIPAGLARTFEQPAGTYYPVQQGDTLAGIALRYGTTLPAILQANNLSQSQFIFPGQEIVIPGSMNQPMGPAMVSEPPQMAMSSSPMSAPGSPVYPPANASAIAPMAPPQGVPPAQAPWVAPNVPMESQSMSAPMMRPNVMGPPAPLPMSGVVFDNEPFIGPGRSAAPDLTLKWEGRVVSQTQPEDWKYPSVLRVNVGAAKGMQVTISKKGNNSWSTTGFTGTKPEYGDGAVEFAPLNPGKHTISLDAQGKGSQMTVNVKPNSLTYVEFVRVRADTGPRS